MSFLDRHVERTDRYVDSLLGADTTARDVPADARLDPDIRRAVRALRVALVRVHPSFRFEERLADELALAAGAARPHPEAASAGAPIAPIGSFGLAGRSPGPSFAVPFTVPASAVRPIVVGGAISLAGAALVAWRMAHGQPVRSGAFASLPALRALPALPALPGSRGRTA